MTRKYTMPRAPRTYGIAPKCKNPICKNSVVRNENTISRHWGLYCSYECSSVNAPILRSSAVDKKYGVSNISKSEKIKDKKRITNFDKCGHTCYLHYAAGKIQKTAIWEDKYGVSHPVQNDKILDKCMKNAHKLKIFVLPTGEEIKVQGFEPFALTALLNTYSENHIKTKKTEVPAIWYTGIDNNKHRYFPDIYIPKDNLIIEVKSVWTFEIEKEKNLLKYQTCTEAGYAFKCMIFDNNGNLLEYIVE